MTDVDITDLESTPSIDDSVSELVDAVETLEIASNVSESNASESNESESNESNDSDDDPIEEKIYEIIEIQRDQKINTYISPRQVAKISAKLIDIVTSCEELILPHLDSLILLEDHLTYVPVRVPISRGHKKQVVGNILPICERVDGAFELSCCDITFSNLIQMKIKKLQHYSIDHSKVHSQYRNFVELVAAICGDDDLDISNICEESLFQIYIWFAKYSPTAAYSVIKQHITKYACMFWLIMSNYIAILKTMSIDICKVLKSIGDNEPTDNDVISNDPVIDKMIRFPNSYCYILHIGTYNVDGIMKHIFKIGKSNRIKSEPLTRLVEHSACRYYPDYSIYAVYRCNNETNLEYLIKHHLDPYKIPWYGLEEVFGLVNYIPLIELNTRIDEYMSLSIDRKKQIDDLQKMQTLKEMNSILTANNEKYLKLLKDAGIPIS